MELTSAAASSQCSFILLFLFFLLFLFLSFLFLLSSWEFMFALLMHQPHRVNSERGVAKTRRMEFGVHYVTLSPTAVTVVHAK